MEKQLFIVLNKTKNITKALIGSYNLSLQGITLSVAPEDIDFLSNNYGVEACSKMFGSPITIERGFKETWFELDGVMVNFTSCEGNPLRSDNFEKFIILLKKLDYQIPCMNLESELEFYKKVGREKDLGKVNLINQKLEQR